MKKVLLVVCVQTLAASGMWAQSGTLSSGGGGSGSGGTFSSSVGLVDYTSYQSKSGSVSCGLQQAYDVSVVTGLTHTDISLSVEAYPNPTASLLVLQVDLAEMAVLSYELLNLNGVVLLKKQISNRETIMDLSSFASGSFVLRVLKNNTELKTFKIIKNA